MSDFFRSFAFFCSAVAFALQSADGMREAEKKVFVMKKKMKKFPGNFFYWMDVVRVFVLRMAMGVVIGSSLPATDICSGGMVFCYRNLFRRHLFQLI